MQRTCAIGSRLLRPIQFCEDLASDQPNQWIVGPGFSRGFHFGLGHGGFAKMQIRPAPAQPFQRVERHRLAAHQFVGLAEENQIVDGIPPYRPHPRRGLFHPFAQAGDIDLFGSRPPFLGLLGLAEPVLRHGQKCFRPGFISVLGRLQPLDGLRELTGAVLVYAVENGQITGFRAFTSYFLG